MTEHFPFAKGRMKSKELANILHKINSKFWNENVQMYPNPTYSACGSLYEWEIKMFLNKGQLNQIITATGYYCGKKQVMIIYKLMG